MHPTEPSTSRFADSRDARPPSRFASYLSADDRRQHRLESWLPRRFFFAVGGCLVLLFFFLVTSTSPSPVRVRSRASSLKKAVRVRDVLNFGTRNVSLQLETQAPYRAALGSDSDAADAEETIEQVTALRQAQLDATRRSQQLAELIPPPVRGPRLARRYRYGSDFKGKPGEASLNIGDDSNVLREDVPDIEAFVTAARRKYEFEESYWRTFAWDAPPVHASIRAWERRLDSEERQIRDGITAMRQNSSRGRPVGLLQPENAVGLEAEQGVTVQSAHRGHAMSRFANAFSNHFGRRGLFGPSSLRQMAILPRGSATKWAELLAEEVSLADGHPPQCTASAKAWFDDYAAKHGQVMAAAARGQGFGRSKFITYICQAGINCGGLGDRLLGMTSAFLYALVTGRAFHTEWQSPIPIEAVFDSPRIDWSFSSFGNWTPALLRDDDMLDSARELDLIHYSAPEMDDAFGTRPWDAELPSELTLHYEDRDLAFAAPWIQLFNNRGFVYRSFSYEPVRKRLHELGLQPHSAFSCIMSYLFEPKPSARDFIQRYTSIFSLPSVFSVGIQIRTGDTSMKDAEYDKVNTVELHNSFFQCAAELAEEYATPGQRVVYFLVTDSQHLREDAAAQLGDTIVTSGLGIEHVHQRSGHVDGVQNAVIEEWILAKTDYRVITQNSGFGKLASLAAAKPSSTVTLFPMNNRDTVGLMTPEALLPLDCRKDNAFTSFEQLASEWSLA